MSPRSDVLLQEELGHHLRHVDMNSIHGIHSVAVFTRLSIFTPGLHAAVALLQALADLSTFTTRRWLQVWRMNWRRVLALFLTDVALHFVRRAKTVTRQVESMFTLFVFSFICHVRGGRCALSDVVGGSGGRGRSQGKTSKAVSQMCAVTS